MRINDIINSKGSSVITARSADSVARLVSLLSDHRIGAVVITDDDRTVTGIAGERDVVNALASHGPHALDLTIAEIMGPDVDTCGPDDEIAEVAKTMTEHRTRHMPVLRDGGFVAIVSIGDLVKSRIDQLQDEQEHLVKYLRGDARSL